MLEIWFLHNFQPFLSKTETIQDLFGPILSPFLPFLKHSAAIFLLVPLFFGPIKVNFRPISNYRDTPNTFSVLTIFETPFFAIFPNFAVFCKKKNKKKHIWLFFPNKKLTITDVSSHFQGFFDISAHFQSKRSKYLGYFSRFKPKIIFFSSFIVCLLSTALIQQFRPILGLVLFCKNKKTKKQGQWKVMLLFFVSFSVKDPAENKRRLSSLFSFHATSSLFPSFHHTPQNDAMIGL